MEEEIKVMDLARALLAAGRREEALTVFSQVLREHAAAPEEQMEAALCVLQEGGDYRTAYDAFLRLCGAGVPEALTALTEAFYLPNERDLRARYRNNTRLLKRYPYLFRRDFPAFEDLPLRFYPYDEESFVPYDTAAGCFLPRYAPREAVITRNFFRDLRQPVFASGVFSQYELEYLRDNVRRSEDVGRENHIYLHYPDWDTFCAYLQALDLRRILREEKVVFLIGGEREQYPIDFAARFGIDYSRYPLRPVGIREVTRLIWHTQLSAHNGGDFFNEIFDGHPNLLCLTSLMLDEVDEQIAMVRQILRASKSAAEARDHFRHWNRPELAEELYRLKDLRDRDILVAMFLNKTDWQSGLDTASRIAPALFFQPHFPSLLYALRLGSGTDARLVSDRQEMILHHPVFQEFPYRKVFTPMRRFTTSYGGTLSFIVREGRKMGLDDMIQNSNGKEISFAPVFPDVLIFRVLNRSFMADPEEPLLRDSVIVRFEDGKLNPEATFTRLAAFLDLPYTKSMTYCSERGERDPHRDLGDNIYAAGFSLTSVYKTYDEYMNENERRFIEYCFRDAYAFYGYDFLAYNGEPVSAEEMDAMVEGFTSLDRLIREDWKTRANYVCPSGKPDYWYVGEPDSLPQRDWDREAALEQQMAEYRHNRKVFGSAMRMQLRFVNKNGVPLRMIPLLEPDPDLLERPLYR